jgi:LacI family transcriptional regulator
MATLRQIAEKAGVSQATVSYVLNGRAGAERISPARVAAVRSVAQQLNFRVNSAAKAISTGKFGSVALLQSMRPHSGFMPPELLDGILEGLAEHDLHLIIAKLPEEQLLSEGAVPKILREWMADGLLIDYIAGIPTQLLDLIDRYHIPSVWMNSKRSSDCVLLDDWDAGKRAAAHLLSLGHRDIAFVCHGQSTHYSITDRFEGFAHAMQEAGLAGRRLGDSEACQVDGDEMRYVMGWLTGESRPSAVVCYSPHEACVVLRAALTAGLQAPRDLSVITFNERASDFGGLPLSTFLLPEKEMGKKAVHSLMAKIRNPKQAIKSEALPFTWFAGQTVSAPSKRTGNM